MSNDSGGRQVKRNGSRARPEDTKNGLPVLGNGGHEKLCKCGKEPALKDSTYGEACRKAKIAELVKNRKALPAPPTPEGEGF